MIITNEASLMLKNAMVTNDCDSIKANVIKSCCGTSLVFTLAKSKAEDQPVLINGISVLFDKEAQDRAEALTIKVENGELEIVDEAASGC